VLVELTFVELVLLLTFELELLDPPPVVPSGFKLEIPLLTNVVGNNG
jgi:hypothetical protein